MRFRAVPSNPSPMIASCAARLAGWEATRRIRSQSGSVSPNRAFRSSQAQGRRS